MPGRSEYRVGMLDMKTLREAADLSQDRLAELVGTSQAQIQRLETGKRRITVQWAQRLAPHLGCKPVELLPLDQSNENLPKEPDINVSVTETPYREPVANESEAITEGKDMVPDAVLTAIGRLTIELESVKAELKQVKADRPDRGPKKAQRK